MQSWTPGVRHVPSPLQVPAVFNLSPLQDGGTQTVSAAYSAQPPKPSHVPVVPQLDGVCIAQMPCGSGPPTSMGQQVPIRAG